MTSTPSTVFDAGEPGSDAYVIGRIEVTSPSSCPAINSTPTKVLVAFFFFTPPLDKFFSVGIVPIWNSLSDKILLCGNYYTLSKLIVFKDTVSGGLNVVF